MGTDATCGSCDWDSNGFKVRCDAPAPYRGDFHCYLHDNCGGDFDYSLCLCERHARVARTDDSLKRIYSA